MPPAAPSAADELEAVAGFIEALRSRVGAAQAAATRAGGDDILAQRATRAEAAIAALSVAFGKAEAALSALEMAAARREQAS